MTVYVDELLDYGVMHGSAGPEWCHCFSDSEDIEELHRFADALGLSRRWFQGPPRSSFPHYDLTANMRAKALRLGATPLTFEQMKPLLAPLRALGRKLIDQEQKGVSAR